MEVDSVLTKMTEMFKTNLADVNVFPRLARYQYALAKFELEVTSKTEPSATDTEQDSPAPSPESDQPSPEGEST